MRSQNNKVINKSCLLKALVGVPSKESSRRAPEMGSWNSKVINKSCLLEALARVLPQESPRRAPPERRSQNTKVINKSCLLEALARDLPQESPRRAPERRSQNNKVINKSCLSGGFRQRLSPGESQESSGKEVPEQQSYQQELPSGGSGRISPQESPRRAAPPEGNTC